MENKEFFTYNEDCLTAMDRMQENIFDTCITDPPYHLKSITKRFGKEGSAPAKFAKDGSFSRISKGFLGKEWDGGEISFDPETWKKVYRVMKPGGTLLCFGGTRTWHRIAVAIEDAGFLITDTIAWVHGQGFPKSLDISKAMDKRAKAERPVIGRAENAEEIMRRARQRDTNNEGLKRDCREDEEWIYNRANITAPATEEAKLWDGWTTALKPAFEPIIVAIKPIDKTYIDNALKWGVSGLWIDGARIEGEDIEVNRTEKWSGFGNKKQPDYETAISSKGRYPSNFIHDGSEEVVALFPFTKSGSGKKTPIKRSKSVDDAMYGNFGESEGSRYADEGSAARFFYCAKASRSEKRDGLGEGENVHPTVKPLALMQYLARLTKTPTGGIVLDPFMGSGTTGLGCLAEGRKFVGIEREKEYYEIANRRLEYVSSGIDGGVQQVE